MPMQNGRESIFQGAWLVLFAVVMWATNPSATFAQLGQTASLVGTVSDASGAPLASVSLTATSPQMIGGVRQTKTDGEGRYRFVSLLPGVYEITVTHPGFKTRVYSETSLLPGLGPTFDIRMELAPVEETVNVPAIAKAQSETVQPPSNRLVLIDEGGTVLEDGGDYYVSFSITVAT